MNLALQERHGWENASPRPTRMDTVEQLVKALTELKTMSRPAITFKSPTFNGDEEVQLFINQFKDAADANHWSEWDTLLHLRGCLEGKTRDYECGTTMQEIYDTLVARFGTSARRAKECLLGLKRGSTGIHLRTGHGDQESSEHISPFYAYGGEGNPVH